MAILVLEYLNTCASLHNITRVKGISDLLGYSKFNLPWIGKLAARTPLANGRRQAPSLFQQTMLERELLAVAVVVLFIVLMSLCCATTTP